MLRKLIHIHPNPLKPLTLEHINFPKWLSKNKDLQKEHGVDDDCENCVGGVVECNECGHEEECNECGGKGKVPPEVLIHLYRQDCRATEDKLLALISGKQPMKPHQLPIGTWVRYKSSHQGSQIAGITKDLCVHLNAQPYVTGTIFDKPPHATGSAVSFRPDGWPLPEETWPQGFSISANDLEIIDKDTHQPEPCTLTDRQCRPIPPEKVEQMVKEYLEKKS